ncbi:MAG: hypothetical protein A2261_04250 [Candidatus Magasanikbacteria bacterium RIFOXYA2_FULL_44_8]|uniref:N-acetyltransferase domain-containing protein n=1 Tax=Candidatus Magasanikbacteria bacterium RIFOXYA2_FULL_44_8 TaxID=1798696 RepID=A0A1F6NKY7_9BACT|nr:MAG: hypothetical protein A2261_04250 [Candidatus Magasanikbacteria bacterium RIFOXYA2_FULL_44_8]
MERRCPGLEEMKITTKKSETKESSFEQAKQAVLDFLATPHFEYRRQHDLIDTTTPNFPSRGTPEFVLPILRNKLSLAMKEAPDDMARAKFIHDLWENDLDEYEKVSAINAASKEETEQFIWYVDNSRTANKPEKRRAEFVPPIFAQRSEDIITDIKENQIFWLANDLDNGEDVQKALNRYVDHHENWDYQKGSYIDKDKYLAKRERYLLAAQEYSKNRKEGKTVRKFETYEQLDRGRFNDVFQAWENDRFSNVKTVFTTYRSFYYPILLEQLYVLGDEQIKEREVLNLLERIDHFGLQMTDVDNKFEAGEIERQGFTKAYDWGHIIHNLEDTEFGKSKELALDILSSLKEVSPAVCEYLSEKGIIEDIDGFRECIYKIIDILNHQPSVSSSRLMDLIQRADTAPVIKSQAIQTLYHLELGKIGMSNKGVNYLGKIFDLGEFNNPNHFAHRVTGDGKVGIFDEQKKAVGYFQLSDLATPEQEIQAQMLEFNLNTLFLSKSGETDRERVEREAILEEFKEKYFATYLTDFYQQTGVHFNNLKFKEQGWFLWYAQHASAEDKTRALEFVKKYRESGFKTFLSLEQDQQGGNDILDIGEKLDAKSASAIFAKYGEIVDAAESVGDYLQEYFGADKFNPNVTRTAADNLLRTGKELLASYADRVQAGEQLDSAQLIAELDKLHVDVRLFLSGFKAVTESGEKIKLSDIKGIDFGSREKVAPDEAGEMEKIININYVGSPLLPGVLAGFEKALTNPDNTFYVLKRDGQIISFFRFENLRDKKGELTSETEFASFNTDSDYKGGSLGRGIMREAVLARGETGAIVADTDPSSRVCQYYVNEAGFVVDGVEVYKQTGQKVFHIRRDNKKLYLLEPDEIDLGKNYDDALNKIEKYIAAGYVLVGYTKDKQSGNYSAKLAREKTGKQSDEELNPESTGPQRATNS